MARDSRDSWITAKLIDRPNRFVVRARLANGEVAEAHLADRGRLVGLLVADAQLRLEPVEASVQRRTRFNARLVRTSAGVWVSLDTNQATRLARGLLERHAIAELPHWPVRREVRLGASRFDFLLEGPRGERCWVEVKSVTFAEDGVALFPDAPTTRGQRHVRELAERVRHVSDSAAVLFVVQRHDADRVEPYSAIDPEFTQALEDAARSGVLLLACGFRMHASGRTEYRGRLPFHLERQEAVAR